MSDDVKSINSDDLLQMVQQNNVLVVDIRDKKSYEKGHVPGALSIFTEDDVKSFLSSTDKTKTVVCCCYHGVSSRTAAAYLQTQGFENVMSLDGGYEAWRVSQGMRH